MDQKTCLTANYQVNERHWFKEKGKNTHQGILSPPHDHWAHTHNTNIRENTTSHGTRNITIVTTSPNRGAVPVTWAELIGCLSLSADVYWKERSISLSRCWFWKILFFSGGGQDPEIDTFVPDTLKAAEFRPQQIWSQDAHMKRVPVLVHSPSEMLAFQSALRQKKSTD